MLNLGEAVFDRDVDVRDLIFFRGEQGDVLLERFQLPLVALYFFKLYLEVDQLWELTLRVHLVLQRLLDILILIRGIRLHSRAR